MRSMRVAAFVLTASVAALAGPARPPVSFEPNRGQAPRSVVLVGHTGSGTMLLERTRAILRGKDGTSVAIVPEGGNATPLVEAEDATGAISNYFLGADASRWVRRVPQYRKARYRELYAGIDLVFHDAGDALEYDLVVAPGAHPRAIRLRYDGARRLTLDASGNLEIETAGGVVRQKRPVLYQEIAGQRREVAGRFVVQGRRVRFLVGEYDRARELVIDPVVVYGTYLGGASRDLGGGVAVDAAGNAYVVGSTVSADFPVTANALQVKHGGIPNSGVSELGANWIYDVFVAKFSPDGSKLVYSTFLGGSGTDVGTAIAVDRSGNAVVAGQTNSQNFPIASGAIQKSAVLGATAGFVTKLNADGSNLLYSTYLGGLGSYTTVQALAIDAAGAVYAAGITDNGQFPTTSGALQSAAAGPLDGYVAKINAQGSALVYATRLGGSGR